MHKVLLIIHSAAKKGNYVNTLPPLGILYISSFLESKGIATDVVDYNVSEVDYSVIEKYDLIGFSVNCGNVTNTLKMARIVKEKYGKDIIVGGPQVTSDPDLFLEKEFIDGAVVGEGEYTLYEYIKNRKGVKGIYVKDEKENIIFGGTRPPIKDLDSLPFPAFDKIDLGKYKVTFKKKKATSTIATSRGCPFGCIFCFHSLGSSFRARSAENVVKEIEWQIKNFGVEEICIQDDNISLYLERAKEIFRKIIDKKLDVVFQLYNGIRADKVDRELMILMKKANLWIISVSPESGHWESLKLMKKGFGNEEVKRVIKWSKELGFFTYSNYMVGFPWETEEHIQKTIDFAIELDTDMVQFARVIAFPNTELYDMCNLDYRIDKDIGLFYSDPKFNLTKLSDSKINEFIRQAYRRCYLKPRKIITLLKNLRFEDLWALFRYSITTKSL